MTDQPTVASMLMELMDASIEQGRAVALGDEIGAGIAYRNALAAFGWLLGHLDPEGAAVARTRMADRSGPVPS